MSPTQRNDYYCRFRDPHWSSTTSNHWHSDPVMGSFDPMTSILRLQWNIAALSSHVTQIDNDYDDLFDWRTQFAIHDPLKATTGFLLDAFPDKWSDNLRYKFPLLVADPKYTNQIHAYATYFHEMLHWWQHIGTTSGFLYGLAIPTCCQQNVDHIKAAVFEASSLKKPLYRYSLVQPGTHSATLEMQINTAVNNWIDVEIGAFLLNTPERANLLIGDQFFDCLGQSIRMLLEYTVGNLVACVDDPRRCVLPDTRQWDDGFDALCHIGARGYRHGEPLILPPFGMEKIMEGQCRLVEMQYLHIVSDGSLSWGEFINDGLIQEQYFQALKFFCEATGLNFPSYPTAPEANLFLLLCDISLNPCVGYPDDITNYAGLLEEISPGIRFLRGCEVVRDQRDLCGDVFSLDRNSYEQVSKTICSAMRVKTPWEIAQSITDLAMRMPSLESLRKEFTGNCKFKLNSVPIRYTFLKHILFMEDKAKHPEIFCWPAQNFTLLSRKKSSIADYAKKLLRKHSPPFFAHGMNSPVVPTPQDGADPSGLERVSATYFKWIIIYDLITQLISRDGPFCFNYVWLNPDKDQDWYQKWIEKDFKDLLGCDIRAIETW
jgi:hypothetical protein